MKVLNILRSEPDKNARWLIEETFRDDEVLEVPLYQEDIDYDDLVRQIFDSDRVVSWW
ncbi:hypothetical protein ACFLU3_03510 [Chloroflexota bacterium]